MQREYGDQVTFIGVAGRDSFESAEKFISDLGLGGFTHVVDLDLEIWRAFEIPDQPAFAFINDDGTIEVQVRQLGVDGITEGINRLLAA